MPIEEQLIPGAISRAPEELANIVTEFASSCGWMDKVRLRVEGRWYERLYHDPDYDIWVISWLPGQSTGFHDHGASSGAFVVASGILEEHRPGEPTRVVYPDNARAFGPNYAHDVRNASVAPAISVHAYSPPLSEMNEYELDEGRLVPRERASDDPETPALERHLRNPSNANPTRALSPTMNIDQVLSGARARLRRLSPDEAFEAVAEKKAVLVDIRPESQREIEGTVAGALIVERNVLEWRLDPSSSARLHLCRILDSGV